MSIDWGKISGAVVGGVCNFFAPGSGEVASKLTEKGFDIASGVVAKIKAGKESGKTEQEIASSLTQQEKAELASGVNEASQMAAAQDATFQAWMNSMSREDEILSTWRKAAKMQGKDPNSAATFGDDGMYLTFGGGKIAKSALVIFKGFPNYTTSTEVIQNAGTMSTAEPTDNYSMQEDVAGTGGTKGIDYAVVPGQTKPKKTASTGYLWLMLLLLAGGLYWFFMVMPGEAARKRAAKARSAKKKKAAEEKTITKPGTKRKPAPKKTTK